MPPNQDKQLTNNNTALVDILRGLLNAGTGPAPQWTQKEIQKTILSVVVGLIFERVWRYFLRGILLILGIFIVLIGIGIFLFLNR
ncbi:MAG TPA: hypothetical protein VD928_00500 [Candidatus Paceibacterota bacterium]|nr:hypothetical protein [Candidatus Paceibacterota bacterium]